MANAFNVPAGVGASAVFMTAIAGDNPYPYGAADLKAGYSLTTGDLSYGDAGDASDLDNFSVEMWVRWDAAAPGANAYIAYGPRSTSGTIRQWGMWIGGTGGFQFTAVESGGTQIFSTQSSALVNGAWYHLVGVVSGGNIYGYVNGVGNGAGVAFGVPIRPASFAATVSAMELVYAGGTDQAMDEVAFYRTALTSARVLEHYNAGVNRGWRKQLPGERIGAALDVASSSAPRSVQAGTRNIIPRYMSGQSPLSEIQHAVEAEDVDAAFFTKADGTLTFLADGHRSSSPYNTSQVTIGDAGGAEIPYESINVDYSQTDLINEWNVTRSVYASASTLAAPATQTASDATSISRYFKRSQSLSDVPITLDSDASAIATALLAKYKDPMLRVTEVTFNLSDPAVAEAVLRRELMDRITVKRTPPGGGSRIDQTLYIQKIEISASNDGQPWKVRWGVSPL